MFRVFLLVALFCAVSDLPNDGVDTHAARDSFAALHNLGPNPVVPGLDPAPEKPYFLKQLQERAKSGEPPRTFRPLPINYQFDLPKTLAEEIGRTRSSG